MAGVPPYVTARVAVPGSAEGQAVLTAYFHDIVSRSHGRQATGDEVRAAMSDEPSDDLRPPHGVFFLARRDAAVVGCVGLRLLPGGIGEITRMFVVPEARRHGVGRQLLQAAEDAAPGFGVTGLRLDTSSHLAEARQLYASHGYHEVAPSMTAATPTAGIRNPCRGKGCATRLRTWVPRMPPPGWPLYGWRWACSPRPAPGAAGNAGLVPC
jgi:GNAT superfamily N-acetyltransferase